MDLVYRYDPFQPLAHKVPSNFDEAIENMRLGNERFVTFVRHMQRATMGQSIDKQIIIPVNPISLGLPLWSGGTVAQSPFGLVLGCADARVPVEQVFDQAFNSLFVIRIAGNVLGTECMASVDFAARSFSNSLKFITVLGHTMCGAVSAAVDTYLRPNDYSEIACTYALRSLVDRLQIAVRGAANALQALTDANIVQHANYRAALIETAVYLNAAITAFDLRRELRVLEKAPCQVMFGAFDLDSQLVRGLPNLPEVAEKSPLMLPAPQTAEEFVGLSASIAKGVLAKGLLK